MIETGKIGMVPLKSVIVEDRSRIELGDIDELEANMKASGLISPLAVRDNQDGTYRLLAGGRRFTVLAKNNVEEIPVRIFDREISDLEMKIIERAENFYRKDLEFWEFDKLTLEIHRLQQSIHGVKAPGPSGTGWSTEDTGDMIGGMSKASVSQAIKRAELREALPEVFDNCKTAADALGVIKKMDEALVKQTIAKHLETKKDDGKMLSQLSKCYIIKDFFKGVKEIPRDIMHLVEIDPPYAIDVKEAKKREGESQYNLQDYNEILASHYMDGSPDGEWLGMKTVFKECYRVMAEHSWLICWFAPEPWFNDIYNAILKAGFKTTRLCGIWTKGSGQTKRPEMHLPNSYEMFFYAWKGRPAIAQPRASNDFRYAPIPSQQKVHPTERPIELTTDLYETFAFPGSRVLIPFLGSGNGLISAYNLGMSAVGFETGKSNKDSFLVKVHGMQSV